MNELDKQVAEKCGWEYLYVDSFPTQNDPNYNSFNPRQKELEYWLEKVEIENVGEYLIKVDLNTWIEPDTYKPSTNLQQAWEAYEQIYFDVLGIKFWTFYCEHKKVFAVDVSTLYGLTHQTSYNSFAEALCLMVVARK